MSREPRYRFQLHTRGDGTWGVDVNEDVKDGELPVGEEPADGTQPDADVVAFYRSVRPRLESHIGDPAALGVVAALLADELEDLKDPQRPNRMAQIETVERELQQFVAALKEFPAAFTWTAHSAGGVDFDSTAWHGGQVDGLAFFPDNAE